MRVFLFSALRHGANNESTSNNTQCINTKHTSQVLPKYLNELPEESRKENLTKFNKEKKPKFKFQNKKMIHLTSQTLTAKEVVQNIFSPLIGVLCSPQADELCYKNNLSFVELLQPFSKLTNDGECVDTNWLFPIEFNLIWVFHFVEMRSVHSWCNGCIDIGQRYPTQLLWC